MANNIYFEKLELEDTFKEWRDKLNNLILNLSDIISIDNISITRNENEELQVTDVIVNSLAGDVKASDYGQIGNAASATGKHLDTLTTDGNYISVGVSVENGWPYSSSGAVCSVRVSSNGTTVYQTLYCSGEGVWQRYSTNSGSSWSKLVPISTRGSRLVVYISKSGNDNNTGTDNAHPVLTINRALQIANGWKPSYTGSYVRFYIGEGDWGSITLNRLPYYLLITSYSGDNATEYSSSLPHFSTITSAGSMLYLGSVVSDRITSTYNGVIVISDHYVRLATIRSQRGSIVIINGGSNAYPVEIVSRDNHDSVYKVDNFGQICHLGARTINVVENLNLSNCFAAARTHASICFGGTNIQLNSEVSVTGKKYIINKTGSISQINLESLPGTVAGTKNVGAIIDGISYGGGDAHTFLAADGTFKKDSDSIYAKDIAIGGDASDLASARGQIGKVETITNADINTIIKSGCYCCRGITSNAPNGNGIGFLIVYSQEDTNGVFVSQIFILHTGNYDSYFTRNSSSNGDNWTNWNKIIDSQSSIGDGITVNDGIISVPEYEGATSSKAGTSGLVPPAATNEINYALCGDGTFKSFLPTSGGSLNGVLNMNNNNIENINHIKFSNNGELWIE